VPSDKLALRLFSLGESQDGALEQQPARFTALLLYSQLMLSYLKKLTHFGALEQQQARFKALLLFSQLMLFLTSKKRKPVLAEPVGMDLPPETVVQMIVVRIMYQTMVLVQAAFRTHAITEV
jgi:hypothetical protein